MPHEMDRQQAAQAQQQLMMQQQQQYAYAQNQHWQQPTQNMGYATYGMAGEYDKPANGGYAYAVDPNEYYASQRAQQQYIQQFSNPMFAAAAQQQQQQQQQFVASYGQQMAERGNAANFNPGAPPPHNQGYPRPPPAVKRAGEAGEAGIHGSPLSVFENQQSSAAYTASWVSSTSSLPPDMKESPEDAHLYHQAATHVAAARGTVPGNEWVQPGAMNTAAVAAAAADYGGTWGERRDENMFTAAGAGVGGGQVAPATFDHTQFARMNIDDTHHHHQQQSYSSAAVGNSGVAAAGGEWNSPEKNHPQQGIKFQTNAWQTNNLNQNQPPPQPLMMLAPQPMNQHQQQNVHQKGGKQMGGFSPMGGKPQQQGGGPRGDGGYNKDAGQLTWEERLKKAQGAKERAEGGRAEGGGRQFGADANGGGTNGSPREGPPPRGRGGARGGRGRGGWSASASGKPRMSRRDQNAEKCGGFGAQFVEPPVENCGGFGANANNEFTENRGGFGGARMNECTESRGGFSSMPNESHVEKCGGFGEQRSYGDRDGGQGEHRGGGGWKGGPPPEAVAQAQQPDSGAFPMMPFGMQGMQGGGGGGGGGWRGGMRGNGGYRGGGGQGGMPNMQMQMRGAAAAAARGAPHPMMMRGPMGSGFPMMPPAGAMGASPMQQQDEKFRSTWLDASMCLPTLVGIPGPMMNHQMNHQMMGGGFAAARGGGFSSPRGGFSTSPRGGRGARGGYRGGRPYNRDRESPRGGAGGYRHEGAVDGELKDDERTPVDSPTEEVAAPEEQQQE